MIELIYMSGYLKKLLSNNNIKNYLIKNHPDIYTEFETVTKPALHE